MKTFKINPSQIASTMIQITTESQNAWTKSAIETVNIQAALTRKNAQMQLKENFTLRNQFSENSILYTSCPANTKRLEDIQSVVGATERAEYLSRQEFGGMHKATGRTLAIPTTTARGGTNAGLIRKQYKLRQMKTVNYSGGREYASKKSHLVAMAQVSFNTKRLLNFKTGIFEVTDFKKNGDAVDFTTKLIRNKKYIQTYTRPSPWLAPAMADPAAKVQEIFNQQMAKK